MKQKHLFLSIAGLSLPMIAFSIGLMGHDVGFQEKNYGGRKVQLFGDRYPEKDYLKEPKAQDYYDLNFQHMGLGGDSLETATVWNNYRGETTTNNKVCVAVIDSGIDIYHEEFVKPEARNIKLDRSNIAQYSLLNPNSAYIYDPTEMGDFVSDVVIKKGVVNCYENEAYSPEGGYYSHGTATSSVIFSQINGVGGFGLAPQSDLLFIKSDLNDTSISVAIKYAADQGADVINMSFGGYSKIFIDGFGDEQIGFSDAADDFDEAVQYATSKGSICVAAAGNEATYEKSYPACTEGVIGVGALDKSSGDTKSTYSNTNSRDDDKYGLHNVDVVAPGHVIAPNATPDAISRDDKDYQAELPSSYYKETRGTSFASPLTAGALALYRCKYPDSTVEQAKQALYNSCYDIGEAGWDNVFGYGRVDIEKLLDQDTPVTKVKFDTPSVDLVASETNNYPTMQLVPTFEPAHASKSFTNGEFFSDNENIVKVNKENGLIGAVSNGTATITYKTNIGKVVGSIKVNVSNINPELAKPFTVEEEDALIRDVAGATYQLNYTSSGPVFFTSANSNIASVNPGGLISFNNYGLARIYAYQGNEIKRINIAVRPQVDAVKLVAVTDESFSNIAKFSEYVDTTGLTFNLELEDGSVIENVKGKLVSGYKYYSFGEQVLTFGASYYGKSFTTDVVFRRTFKDTPDEGYYLDDAFSFYAALDIGNSFSQGNGQMIGNRQSTWNLEYTYEGNVKPAFTYETGIQCDVLGTEGGVLPTSVTITTSSFKNHIFKYVVPALSSQGATLKVKVGEVYYDYVDDGQLNGDSVILSDDPAQNYSFYGDSKGKLTIEITNITHPVKIGMILVDVPEQQILYYNMYSKAAAFKDYVINISSCASDWTDRTLIAYIIDEFNNLSQTIKNTKRFTKEFEDKGGYTTCLNDKLKMMVSEYNSTLKPNEEKLTLVLKVDANGKPIETYEGENVNSILPMNTITIISVSIVSIAIIATIIFVSIKFKSRKQK